MGFLSDWLGHKLPVKTAVNTASWWRLNSPYFVSYRENPRIFLLLLSFFLLKLPQCFEILGLNFYDRKFSFWRRISLPFLPHLIPLESFFFLYNLVDFAQNLILFLLIGESIEEFFLWNAIFHKQWFLVFLKSGRILLISWCLMDLRRGWLVCNRMMFSLSKK